MIRVDGITTSDLDDPIVWERYAQRVTPDGIRFHHLTLTQSARDGLLKHFGQEWLEAYYAKAESNLEAWKQTGTWGVQ